MFARARRSEGDRLPLGAEAALWSIIEVIPDPRNHLALTRDPTCEIRLSAAQIEAAAAAPVPAAAASASPDTVRWSPDAAEVGPPGPAVGDPPVASATASVHGLPTLDHRTQPASVGELVPALFAESA